MAVCVCHIASCWLVRRLVGCRFFFWFLLANAEPTYFRFALVHDGIPSKPMVLSRHVVERAQPKPQPKPKSSKWQPVVAFSGEWLFSEIDLRCGGTFTSPSDCELVRSRIKH